MKKLMSLLTLVLGLWQTVLSQTTVGGQQVITLPSSPWATTQALLSLPSNYDSTTTETFPLIVFLHGVGQAGTNISNMLTDQGGLPYRISQGFVPQAISPVDGKLYKFIVVSPQSPSWSYQYQQIQFILPGILAKYRVDTTRIYITGLSAGGNGALTCITDDPNFCGKIAAVSVMSAASITATEAAAMKNVDINHLPFWDICGTADPNGFYPPNVAYVDSVWANHPNPTPDSTWLYNVGHSSWFEGYDPTWHGRSGHSNGLNMYQWFLLWQRGVTIPWGPGNTGVTPPPNPTAKTTSNSYTITLPLDSVALDATPSVAPSGGSITNYQWSELSGPSTYTFTAPTSSKTTLTNLIAGTYKVLLAVTGNLGGVGYDTVTVTVNPSTHTPPKVVIAPSSATLTLPTNSATLNGASSTDAGATITSYTWAYVSGPTAYALVNGTTSTATLSSLVSGTYIFSLTVKDNLGATATGYDTVTVNPPPPANTPPVAATTANNISVTLPVDSVVLNASPSAAPSGATITSYAWSLLSGPAGDAIVSPNSAVTTITGLTAGTYSFLLVVTDNQGLSSNDTVKVIVAAASGTGCSGKRIVLAQQADNGITLNGPSFSYNPGDTLVIPVTGTPYTWLDFNDMYGTATCPVVITNGGGQVVATTRFNCGNCRYVHMTGTGSSDQYGFLIQNPQKVSAGVDIYGRSAYVELDHISIHNMDYGIWAKQDQGCIDSLNYPNWTIDHISIHDNRIVGMYDEGMYLGTTDPNGTRIVTCNGVQPNPLPKPLRLSNFSIYNNVIDSTGRSGIQLSDAQTGDNEIYNNRISNSGLQLNPQQGNGIVLGGYSQAHIHDNVITNTFTMGIFSLGAGLIQIDHNIISLSGHLEGGSPQSASIMVDTRPTSPTDSTNFIITNNTLGTNTDLNIRVYSSYPTYAYANVICSNTLPSGAPAVYNVASGIHYTTNCTIQPPGNGAPVARAGGTYTITLPVDSVTLNGSASSDATATIQNYTWTYISGPGTPVFANAGTPKPLVSNLQAGTYKVLLTVIDNTVRTASDTATIVVLPSAAQLAGTGPVANAGAKRDTIFLPSDSASLNGTGSYARGGASIRSYQWSVIGGPSGYILGNNSSAIAYLTHMQQTGTYTVVLTVTDNNGLTGSDTAVYTVLNYSQIPVAVISNTDTVKTLPATLTLDGTHSYAGPNTSLVSFQWVQTAGPNTATLATATSPTTAVTGLVAGVYTFKLTVTDVEGQPASTTINIRVVAGSGGPLANAGANQAITLPTNSVTLNGTGSSETGNGQIVSYAWSVVGGPTQYTWTGQSSSTATLGNLVAGTYSVQLKITDNLGLTSTATVTITVNPAIPPTAIISNTDTLLTLPASLVLTGSASSAPAGTTITSYQWTQVSGPNTATLATPTGSTSAVSNLVAGTYTFQLTVKDGQGISSTATINITVQAAAPTGTPLANAGPDVTITLPTNSVTLNGTASRESGTGNIVSYLWTVVSGPTQYTLTNPDSSIGKISNLAAGAYLLVLEVTDNYGNKATDLLNITVNPPVTPLTAVISNTDTLLTLPASLTLDGTQSVVPSGTTITSYQWTELSGPNTVTSHNPTGSTDAISNLAAGTYTFELTVTDGLGETSSTTMKFYVTASNTTGTPLANAGPDLTITLPASSATLNGTASRESGSGNIVSYLWTVVSGPTQYSLSSPDSSIAQLSNLAVGVYTLVLKVGDNNGQYATDIMTVTVDASTQAPTAIISNTDTVLTLPASLTLDGSQSTAPAGTTITGYQWLELSGPSTVSLGSASGATTTVGNLVAGTYSFQLTVTDGVGVSASTTVQIGVSTASGGPIANAGSNITITLPTSSVSLNGSGSTESGSGQIVGYDWTIVSGPAQYNLTNQTNAVADLGNLTVGVYKAVLVVTDNNGKTSSDTVQITVNPPSALPTAVISNTDTVITQADSLVNFMLDGSQSYAATGNTLVSYQWTEIAGPSSADLATVNQATTNVNGLIPGTYLFQLTVTDNLGQQSTASIVIHVGALAPGSISIYPNPVKDNLYVTLTGAVSGNVSLLIYDVSGNLLQATVVQKAPETTITEDLDTKSLFNNATYFLVIKANGVSTTFKFMKLH